MSKSLDELMDYTISELHSSDAIKIHTGKTIIDAARLLGSGGIGSLLVVDQNEELRGIVTERDILKVYASGEFNGSQKLETIMTTDIVSIGANESVVIALGEMLSKNIRHLPVVTMDGSPLGVLSLRDLMAFIAKHIG